RAEVDCPRALQRVGGDGRVDTGLGDPAPGGRRRRGPRLDVASRRWLHRQSALRQKGGAGEAEATGRNPTDRGKPGTKRHLCPEANGLPVAVVLSGAHRHDMKKLAELLDAMVVEPTPTEPPHLALDRGYDDDACRDVAAGRGDVAHIPPKA